MEKGLWLAKPERIATSGRGTVGSPRSDFECSMRRCTPVAVSTRSILASMPSGARSPLPPRLAMHAVSHDAAVPVKIRENAKNSTDPAGAGTVVFLRPEGLRRCHVAPHDGADEVAVAS